MKRHARTSFAAASACGTLLALSLTACGTDTPPPPVPQDPPAAVAPANPGPDQADSNAAASGNEAEGQEQQGQEQEEQYVRACINPDTNERVDDAECEAAIGDTDDPDQVQEVHYHNHGGGILTPLLWYYIGRSSVGGAGPIIPAVGSSMANTPGSTTPPREGVIAKNVSRDARPFSESYRSAKTATPAKYGTTTGGFGGKKSTGKPGTAPPAGGEKNTSPRGGENKGTNNSNNSGTKGKSSGSKSGGFGGGKATGGSHGG